MYDGPLRYLCSSRSDPNAEYLVELDSYRGNGQCDCEWFRFKLEQFLKSGMPPEQAVVEGHVSLTVKKTGEVKHMADALRCAHLIEARRQFADDNIPKFHAIAKKQADEARRTTETKNRIAEQREAESAPDFEKDPY